MHPRSAQTSVCFYAREIRRKAHDKNMVLNKNLWCEWREPICTSPVLSKWQITVELQDYYTLWTECQLLSRTVLAQQPHSEPGCGNGCQTGASESIHCEVTIRAHYRSTFIHVFIVSDAVAWQHPWNCYGNMPSDVKIDDSEFTSWLCKIEIIAFWRQTKSQTGFFPIWNPFYAVGVWVLRWLWRLNSEADRLSFIEAISLLAAPRLLATALTWVDVTGWFASWNRHLPGNKIITENW